ncbi:restriction endonuclease subunit S [Acetobacter malorum]|nr:restriction endonuclease subunit S [Acetobacter malorum]
MKNRDMKLSDLIEIKHGFAFKGEFFSDIPTAYVLATPGNFAIGGGFQWGKMKYYNGALPDGYCLSEGDIIVTMTDLSKEADTLGYAASVPASTDILLHNQRIGKIIPKKKEVNIRFIYWLMRSPDYRDEILASYTGSTVKHTSPSRILSFEFTCPSPEDQHRIALILDFLDNKIDLNRRTNETLEAMARALFRDWFVDFGPTRAKMAGEAPYLAPELWELFPDRLDDEGNPEGWKIGELQELTVNICNGGTPKRTESSYWENGDIPWLTSGEIRKQYISETENHITNEGLENSSAKWIPAGSIVIALYGATAGEVGLTAAKMTTNQAISSLMPKSICKAYIFLHMLHSKINLANKATGSAQQNLSKNLIETFETLIPSDKILYEFENKTSLLFDRIIKNFDESHTLAQLRDLLLPKLMSGEISIRDAEKMVDNAA